MPDMWTGAVVALLSLAVAAATGAERAPNAATAWADRVVAPATDGSGGVAAAMTFPDLRRDRSVIVIEESPAPGCQPWRWNRDQTDCINATVQHAQRVGARAIGFTRGREYRYGNELWLAPGMVAGAVGNAALPRPILRGSRTARGVMLREGGEIRNLDIRGPHFGAIRFRVRKHEDWQFKGINAANQSHWSVVGTSVNGFAGTGLLAVMGDNVRVVGSTFAHNGYSGVSLFPHDGNCGTGVEFRGNVLERNGQNGVDTCSSDARFIGNIFRHNGWDLNAGDSNGLLVWTFPVPRTVNNRIADNTVHGNAEHGIRVSGVGLSGVVIEGNEVRDNGLWGVHVGGDGGAVRDVVVRNNRVARNALGCLSPETAALGARPQTAGCAG
jgi:parallel beta-helix repeat protein